MARPCSCDAPPVPGGPYRAELARTDNPPAPPVTEYVPVDLGGERLGGQFTPTDVVATSAPPPCPPPAMLPQRPAMHPSGRRLTLVRSWFDFPIMRGNHAEVARVNGRSTAEQAPVEMRGNTLRAAPDPIEPSWSEVTS